MKPILFFDMETTGLPDWKIPSEDESQPHIVQLAAILADADTREVISSMDVIIKPEGWTIPQEMIDIHGISQEHALLVGVPEKVAVEMLLSMWNSHARCAYNRTFDQRIIRIALKRMFPESVQEAWAEKDTFHCSMQAAQKHIGSRVKLIEAYKHFTGKDLEDAHSAMADTRACMELWWAMEDIKADA